MKVTMLVVDVLVVGFLSNTFLAIFTFLIANIAI